MKKDCWDKTKIVFEIIFGSIIGVILAFYGYQINSNLKHKELNIKMMEVAIDILTTKPSQETNSLREWAIEIMNRYSEVPLSEEAKRELKKRPIYLLTDLLTENGTWAPSVQYTTGNASKDYAQVILVNKAKYTLDRETVMISFDFLVDLRKVPIGSVLAITGLPVVVQDRYVTEFNLHQTGLNYSGELTVSARHGTTYFEVMVNTGCTEKAYITDGSETSVRFWGYIKYETI